MGTLVLGPWYLDPDHAGTVDTATGTRRGLVWLPTALFTALRWEVHPGPPPGVHVWLSTSNHSASAWQLDAVQWWPATGDLFVTVTIRPWQPPDIPWTWTSPLTWADTGTAGHGHVRVEPPLTVQRLYVICHHPVADWEAWQPDTHQVGDLTVSVTPDPLRHGIFVYLAWMTLAWMQRGLLQRGYADLSFPVDDLWYEVLETVPWPGAYVDAGGTRVTVDLDPGPDLDADLRAPLAPGLALARARTRTQTQTRHRTRRYWHSPFRPMAEWATLTGSAAPVTPVATWAPPRHVRAVVATAWARHVRDAQYQWLRHVWAAYQRGAASWNAVVRAYDICTEPEPDLPDDDTVGPSPSTQWPAPPRQRPCWTRAPAHQARRWWRRTLGKWSLEATLEARLGSHPYTYGV